MVTIKDIAEMVGTSTTTVSNVLHGKLNKVSKETVEKVQRVIEEQNYVLPMGTSRLTAKRSQIIGVVIWESLHYDTSILADPFYATVVGALERVISNAGYYMMLYSSRYMDDIYRMARAWNVDGLILLGMIHDDFARIKSKYKKPAVLIDSYAPRNVADYVNVGLDDEQACYDMAKYLLEN